MPVLLTVGDVWPIMVATELVVSMVSLLVTLEAVDVINVALV